MHDFLSNPVFFAPIVRIKTLVTVDELMSIRNQDYRMDLFASYHIA